MANQLVKLNQWHKAYIVAGCALGMWLASQAPIGRWGKGVFLSLSLLQSVALVRIAKPLIVEEAFTVAKAVMDKELKNTELVLQTNQLEGEMQQVYTKESTSDPEVITELRESLEALWNHVATEPDADFPTSTNNKSLYLAVVTLLEVGKTETFIIEEVLQHKGRQFKEGKRLLNELLKEGRENEW